MRLLIERNLDEFDTVVEEIVLNESTKEKAYWINGPFLQSEIKNHNRRMYPKKVLAKEASRYIKEKIEDHQSVGELGHPDSPTINLDRVSHKIVSLSEDGNNWIGKAKIIDTPFGKIVKNLMDEKVKFGVSSRGLGSLKEEGGVNIVCEDYYLITPADIVSDPSGPNCFVNAVMENREWAWDSSGRLIERETEVKKIITTAASKHKLDEDGLLKVFNQIISLI
jgi:hypothetical protein